MSHFPIFSIYNIIIMFILCVSGLLNYLLLFLVSDTVNIYINYFSYSVLFHNERYT